MTSQIHSKQSQEEGVSYENGFHCRFPERKIKYGDISEVFLKCFIGKTR